MSVWDKIAGTQETSFQVGLAGPKLKKNGDVLEIRNSDDSGFEVGRCDDPLGDDDIVNKRYADSLSKPIIISRQADTSSAIPANTAARGYLLPTTVGTGVSNGDLLYDDGSATGDMSILTVIEGRTVTVTDALVGGTFEYNADTVYVWDADGSKWVGVGGAGFGAVKTVELAIGTSATYTSYKKIPLGCTIHNRSVVITTPFSATATITVGSTSTANRYQDTTDNDPQTAGEYTVGERTTSEAADEAVVIAIANTPVAGAGYVYVQYSLPLS